MYGPSDGMLRAIVGLAIVAIVGAIAAVLALVVGVPAFIWWAIAHVSIR